ncbi:MAG: CDP-glycerol glycerophosphotransferase family protein [Cyanobacteria bacterium RUI128]|nr:CDP-glycerol glycerophosphotransferase family protein [Cyanobacteria bacterium RUI128]
MDQLKNIKPRQISIEEKLSNLENANTFYNIQVELLIQKGINYDKKLILLDKKVKFANGLTKPSVGILIYHRAHWAMDSLYKALEKEGFDVKIIITTAIEMDEELREKEAEDNYNFFLNKGYNVIKGYDCETNTAFDLQLNLPDIVIYQTHWMTDYPEEYNITHLYDKALCLSIPYGIYVAAIQDYQFNQEFHNLVWINCEENPVAKEMAVKYASNKGANAILTGYPKMDALFSESTEYEWKNNENKKVIWAPHYSIENAPNIDFANFHHYYKDFFKYLTDNRNVDIVLKPHPLLRNRCSQTNTMTPNEYDNYISSWENSPNGLYQDSGEYMGLFKTSDAMVLDSLSFIAEYLYTKKPICFINKFADFDELLGKFNEFGQLAIKNCYIAQNWDDIEWFLTEVVQKGNDPKKAEREKFFDDYLDINTGHVGEFITSKIKEELGIR